MSYDPDKAERLRRARERGEHGEHVFTGSIIIILVGLVTAFNSVRFFMAMDDYDGDVRTVAMVFGIAYALAAGLYFLFFLWAKNSPKPASVCALLLYLATLTFLGFLSLEIVASGIVWKGLIVLALIQAIRSASALDSSKSGPIGTKAR